MNDELYAKKTQILGRAVVADGRLKQVQQRLDFSANIMAEMLDVAPTTYRKWMREPETNLWPAIALRVGEFYRDAIRLLGELSQEGTKIDAYVPIHRVTELIGWPHEMLMAEIRAGRVEADDFEVFGLWIPTEEVERLRKERHRVAA